MAIFMHPALFGVAIASLFVQVADDLFPLAPEPTPPGVKDFQRQAAILDSDAIDYKRRDAAKWLVDNAADKNAIHATDSLKRCVRNHFDFDTRILALDAWAAIASKRDELCPIEIINLMRGDFLMREAAASAATYFKRFPEGSVKLFWEGTKSHDTAVRCDSYILLGIACRKDKRVIDAIERAKTDDAFLVRNRAHFAMYEATGDFAAYLAYLIRLQEEPDSAFVPIVTPEGQPRTAEETRLSLAQLGSALGTAKWRDERPDELAPALLKLLDDPSPAIRRGAARLIGAATLKPIAIDKIATPSPIRTDGNFDPAKRPSKAAHVLQKLGAEARLRQVVEKDADPSVQAAARRALELHEYMRELHPLAPTGPPPKRK